MEFRTRDNRNRQSARNEQQSSRGRTATRRPLVRQYPLRDREASSNSVQTRSLQRDASTSIERTRPETRATTAAANIRTRSGQSSSRGPSPRRTNLRRVPAMTSLIPPAPRMPHIDPDMNVNVARAARRREEIRERTNRLRQERQRLQNIRDMISRREQRVAVPSTSSSRVRTGLSDSSVRQNTSNDAGPTSSRVEGTNFLGYLSNRFNGVSTRTRSRQNIVENLNGSSSTSSSSSSSSSSSNSSLVSISSASSDDIAIINEEPPRRRRRMNTLSSSD